MVFEVGKCYQHTTGTQITLVEEIFSGWLGKHYVALTPNGTFKAFMPKQENIENWHEITEEEWLKNFS
jgi:hypothetical protein